MRIFFTISLLFSALYTIVAQPINDDCGDAIDLSLTAAPACPNTSSVTNSFSFDNIDGTAISPYPAFTGCPSGSTNGPAAEVWFTFTATANQTTVSVNGLTQPNIVIYQGGDCISLIALNCTSANGTATVAANTLIGNTYYILVSGGDIDDTGNFDIDITSNNLCNSCAPPGAIELIPNPPPINGTYPSGQTVQFCVNINEWEGNAAGTIEWLHAVTFEFGDGWDDGSISPSPPSSCDGNGNWSWYDSWTGSNTGDMFGPGFAYDSNQGGPLDGNPGNNWGDGGGVCDDVPNSNISAFEFCFDITVSDCPPNDTNDDIGLTVNIWSDGDSGSWNQTGCNSGQEFDITSSVICCNDDDPLVTTFDPTCGGDSDGYLEIEGNGGFDPGEVFNFYVFDSNNNIVYECLSCSGLITTPADLPAGSYSVTALNVGNDCPRSFGPFDLIEPDQPVADIVVLNMPCPGGLATLEGSVDSPGFGDIYSWEGPLGETYSGETIDVPNEGTYTLNVEVDGCPSTEATVEVEFVDFSVEIFGDDETCIDADFMLEASDGVSWEWTDENTGSIVGTDQILDYVITQDATITVEATDPNGCTATASIDMIVNELPEIDIEIIGSGCSNEETILSASGAGPGGTYVWQDDQFESNPRTLNSPDPGFYTYEVIGIDANGCEGFQTVDIEIVAPPNAFLTPDALSVCEGETVTILAEADDDIGAIEWLNGVGSPNENPITVTITGPTLIEANISNSDGCTSMGVFTTIGIDQPLAPPVIQCGANSATTVSFSWNDIVGADEYEISIDGDDPFTINTPFYDVSGLSPNQMVTITVQALGADLCPVELAMGTCPTLDCPAFTLDITDVAPICLDGNNTAINLAFTASGTGGTLLWSGTGITDVNNGVFDPASAGVGMHEITLTYTDGDCVYSDMTTIIVSNTPTSGFNISQPITCTNQAVMLTYTGTAGVGATYDWGLSGGTPSPATGQGPHSVQWATGGIKMITLTVTENGCVSSETTHNINVEAPIVAPILTCGTSTTSSATFNWDPVVGATSYTVNVTSGHTGVLAGTSYTVDNLMPGEMVTLTVTAETSNVCGPVTSQSMTCSASTCPNFIIDITALQDICLTSMNTVVDLSATVAGGDGNGALTWSGTGVAGTQFNSIVAGVNTHTITATYTEGNCSESATTTVNVFPTPTADFVISNGPICIDDNATITYGGSATATATYTWNFNGGTIVSGADAGPYVISWPTAGDKTVSLTVTENNCASTSFTQNILVEAPMAEPLINCTPNTNVIVFSWDAIVGATGYEVNIVSAPAAAVGVLDEANRTYTVTGLMAGEDVEIEVIAIGMGACGNSSNTFTCQAQNCPMVSLEITDVEPICLLPGTMNTTLNAVITGGDGNGILTWSGDGVIDVNGGVFSADTAGIGTVTITATYEQDGCTFLATTAIVVNPQPTATFTVDTPLCVNEPSNIIYTGTGSGTATYMWNFDSGQEISGADAGPYEINWTTGGSYSPSLTVTENNCASEPFIAMVEVSDSIIAPQIDCGGDNTSIIFTWNDVVGATGYQVDVLNAPAGGMEVDDTANRTYSFLNLAPGDEASIRVTVLTDNVCGSVSSAVTCAAQLCPDRAFDMTGYGPFCTDEGIQMLVPSIEGNTDNGTFTWSGSIVTIDGQFDTSTAAIGDNIVQLTYSEEGCDYTIDYTIVVNAVPVASFMVVEEICITNNSMITFTGSAGGGANFMWDFDGGTIVSGSAAGPYEISWPAGGDYNPSLMIVENGCSSMATSTLVTVSEPLEPLTNMCSGDNTSIVFTWNDIPGATDYQVVVMSSPAGAMEVPDIANRTYSFLNVTPGDEAVIIVTALTDNICGNISQEFSCSALECPARAFGTTGYGPFCLNDDIQTLVPELEGNTDNGTFTWSGATVSTDGQFDPSLATLGDNIIQLSYEESGCFYNTIYTVVVNGLPEASFTVDDPVCINQSSTITFTGTAGVTASYAWDFGDGVVQIGSGVGPYEVSWSTPGTRTVGLTVTENNCQSTLAEEMLEVQDTLAPVNVFCVGGSVSSVTFEWDDVVGADTYMVNVLQGPVGVEAGNTYTMSDLTPGQEVIIEVIASGATICEPSRGQTTCLALECQPLTFSVDGPTDVCSGDDVNVTVNYSGGQGGPLTIDYTVDNIAFQATGIASGDNIALGALTASTAFSVTQVTEETNANCSSNPVADLMINIAEENNAGTATIIDPICDDEAVTFDLFVSLTDEDANGVWTETSAVPSTGNAFNTTTGVFNTNGQNAGDYSFVYTVDNGICPPAMATLNVTILATPTADAGEDQTLTCNMGAVSLGGNSTSGDDITYEWESDNPDAMITDPTMPLIDVSSTGTYTLTVNSTDGCSDADIVVVDSELDVPFGDVSISPISCFQANDGAIIINEVTGGVPPYTFSLNGGEPTMNPFFGNLSGAEYMLNIVDANGCFTELLVTMMEPQEVAVELTTIVEGTEEDEEENTINLGESITLYADFDPALEIDTIIWQPDSIVVNNAQSVEVSPEETTTYTVTITDINGCTDSDQRTIIVNKNRNIFVPTAFAPNGTNNILYVQGGVNVASVKSFVVFNRWGETVFENYNFQPNSPSAGWDGTFRGQMMNTAVFVYMAEVEFTDGEVVLFKGDVMLMR